MSPLVHLVLKRYSISRKLRQWHLAGATDLQLRTSPSLPPPLPPWIATPLDREPVLCSVWWKWLPFNGSSTPITLGLSDSGYSAYRMFCGCFPYLCCWWALPGTKHCTYPKQGLRRLPLRVPESGAPRLEGPLRRGHWHWRRLRSRLCHRHHPRRHPGMILVIVAPKLQNCPHFSPYFA